MKLASKPAAVFLAFIFGIFFFSSPVFSETQVSGAIDVDTTWTVVGSPYIVTADVTVNAGKTLTVEPGVTVKFNSNTGLNNKR